jgi:asparagine synthase (glutamine-hydrolysing)
MMKLAAAIPPELKLKGLEKKVALREALGAWLPRDVLDRPKMGFGVPIGAWFRNELRSYVQEVLLDAGSLARGYFRPEYVHRLLARHFEGREDESPRIWSLLISELWHRTYVDRVSTVDVTAAAGS